MSVKLALSCQNIVGESLVWDELKSTLLWVDIINKKIHSFSPDTQMHESWDTPDFVTSIGLRKDAGAIIGLTKAVYKWDHGSTFDKLADIEQELPDNRANEGVVGPDGAFWVGTMQNNIMPNGAPKEISQDTGRIYRIVPSGEVSLVCEDLFGITNTFVWGPNNEFITADTVKNVIYRYDYDASRGRISNRKPILSNFDRGLPDGSCLDAEGYIWNCRVVGGACLVRMDAEGVIDRVIDLPCSWPTSCTFGGADLDTLFVTSARFTMTPEYLKSNPHEGGLFSVDVGVKGLPPHKFG